MVNRIMSRSYSLSVDKRTSINRMVEDLRKLSEDTESADIVFRLGPNEEVVHAHRIILMARCKSFQNLRRGEICRVTGCVASPGPPVTIRMPKTSVETFKQFIQYIYTGQTLLIDNSIFEMILLAHDFEIDDLHTACENFLATILSTSNACSLLATALDMQGSSPGNKPANDFVKKCRKFIQQNAAECVQTNSFLSLNKATVISLISSNEFFLEEENIWRAVLNWAKHQAGVTQPTVHWTEEERSRVCQHLSSDVLNHIRLLEIDSKVFADEVEPTGAVPMEVSLERYKLAALSGKLSDCSVSSAEDKSMKRRSVSSIFINSTILTKSLYHLQKQLHQWSGESKKHWKLIFRASSHDFQASAFHKYCDGISPTFVVVQGHDGEICGGYMDAPWSQPTPRYGYRRSEKAFLFSANDPDRTPKQFMIQKRGFALSYHIEYGPMFGGGADLCISNECHLNTESYSNFPHSYNGEGACSTSLMKEYNFSVKEYEVFTVSSSSK